jgi:dTDP-4-amino-4,6-dideoxygalactose transaminase
VDEYIPYIRHSPVTEWQKEFVLKSLDGNLTKGNYVTKLEALFKHKYRKKFAVSCTSGTAALYLAYRSMPEYRILMPSLTFKATAVAAEVAGKTPRYVDSAYSPDVKVSIGGYVPSGWSKVEDAAHAFDSDGVGDAGITCFSLHAIKNLGVGEGGMCVTSNKDHFISMARNREYGSPHNPSLQFRMSEMSAALGVARFRSTHKEERKTMREVYKDELGDMVEFHEENGGECWHLCQIFSKNSAGITKMFDESNIGWQKHYKPLFYLAHAKRRWEDTVSIPFFPGLTELQQDRVIAAVRHAFN